MNFDYCLQTKKKRTKKTKKKKQNKTKKKQSTVINNFYPLALDYLESWLILMIVSVFVLESRQMGTFEIVNVKHDD